jgi:hypothetical protein
MYTLTNINNKALWFRKFMEVHNIDYYELTHDDLGEYLLKYKGIYNRNDTSVTFKSHKDYVYFLMRFT